MIAAAIAVIPAAIVVVAAVVVISVAVVVTVAVAGIVGNMEKANQKLPISSNNTLVFIN